MEEEKLLEEIHKTIESMHEVRDHVERKSYDFQAVTEHVRNALESLKSAESILRGHNL